MQLARLPPVSSHCVIPGWGRCRKMNSFTLSAPHLSHYHHHPLAHQRLLVRSVKQKGGVGGKQWFSICVVCDFALVSCRFAIGEWQTADDVDDRLFGCLASSASQTKLSVRIRGGLPPENRSHVGHGS